MLVNTERLLIGIKAFDPGEEFPNHVHSTTTETFIGVDGEVELWLDREERVFLTSGVTTSVPPGHEHYLRNVSGMPAVILYIKAPHRAQDVVLMGWVPDNDCTESVERETDPQDPSSSVGAEAELDHLGAQAYRPLRSMTARASQDRSYEAHSPRTPLAFGQS